MPANNATSIARMPVPELPIGPLSAPKERSAA